MLIQQRVTIQMIAEFNSTLISSSSYSLNPDILLPCVVLSLSQRLTPFSKPSCSHFMETNTKAEKSIFSSRCSSLYSLRNSRPPPNLGHYFVPILRFLVWWRPTPAVALVKVTWRAFLQNGSTVWLNTKIWIWRLTQSRWALVLIPAIVFGRSRLSTGLRADDQPNWRRDRLASVEPPSWSSSRNCCRKSWCSSYYCSATDYAHGNRQQFFTDNNREHG